MAGMGLKVEVGVVVAVLEVEVVENRDETDHLVYC